MGVRAPQQGRHAGSLSPVSYLTHWSPSFSVFGPTNYHAGTAVAQYQSMQILRRSGLLLSLGLVLHLFACGQEELEEIPPSEDVNDLLFGGLSERCQFDWNCDDIYQCMEAVPQVGEEQGKRRCMMGDHESDWYSNWSSEDYDRLRETGSCQDCRLQWAVLIKADLAGADLENAFIARSILHDAVFDGANLASVNFIDAHLNGASFVGANLKEASFLYADLKDVDFSGADLSGAYLTTKQTGSGTKSFDNTRCDEDTIFPEGFYGGKDPARIYCENGIVTWDDAQ